ncbi:hypothetical protein [Schumannella sp. 10F1B-5-1]|uniref:hypothetical protein n=1 Tax=Schumannella sp. 10F1B-5-1 TaxID=2590780 RepID=UPI00113169AF|nr:hypothetical protein [Schumannella sp. 10F1B-5-1]TPW78501.1 hypothetical protein FJ658_01535 [Schumannella sp. 10F1B-5-1]
MSEKNLTSEQEALVKSTRRFDLRRILGALFVVYGLIVGITGFVTVGSTDELERTGGIAINLWTGGAMLVVGILFFVWDRLSPVPAEDIVKSDEQVEAERAEGEAKVD